MKINSLTAHANEGNNILNGVSLTFKPGQTHVIMGKNGSGKSTLAHVIAGNPRYQVSQGSIELFGQDITHLSADKRAALGIFLSFQQPVAIPGVNTLSFIRTAMNALGKARGLEPIDAYDFMPMVQAKLKALGLDDAFVKRCVNDGFSGGERKYLETLQMMMLNPKVMILDETDSGLDVDAINRVGSAINKLKSKDNIIIMITHYQRFIDIIKPDEVHVLEKGKIIQSAGPELAKNIDQHGFGLNDAGVFT